MALEAAQYIESTRHHLDDITIAGKVAGEHALLA
jgi:hypothetical protein